MQPSSCSCCILSGPNMSGKSIYLRQVGCSFTRVCVSERERVRARKEREREREREREKVRACVYACVFVCVFVWYIHSGPNMSGKSIYLRQVGCDLTCVFE